MGIPSGDIIKRYIHRNKMVMIMRFEKEDEIMYSFKITDNSNKKDYYSDKYDTFDKCERDSYKVVKGI